MRMNLANHHQKCPEAFYDCVKCGVVLKRKETENHLKECPEEETECEKCKALLKNNIRDEHNCIEYLLSITQNLQEESDLQQLEIRYLQAESENQDQLNKQFGRIC